MITRKCKISLLVVLLLAPLSRYCEYVVRLQMANKHPLDLALYLDVGIAHTLVMSKQIDCDKLDACTWFDQNERTDSYHNTNYNYKQAHITVILPSLDSQDGDPLEVQLLVRLTESIEFNVLGVNDASDIAGSLSSGHELVIDLGLKTLGVQTVQSGDGRRPTQE